MPSLFCDTDLAARIERAEVQLITLLGEATRRRTKALDGFAIPIAGGLASFAEHGSPYNKVVGLGFGGVPSTRALDEIEHAYAACGAPTQIELAHLADPEIGELLTGRGYRLESFENVLGCAIEPGLERATPAGIEVRRSGDEELDAWIDVVVDAAAHPDTQGVAWHEEFPRKILENAERDSAAAGLARYAALHDGCSPAARACASTSASRSSPVQGRHRDIASEEFKAHCSPTAWRTPRTPAATSPSSRLNRDRGRIRTRNDGASTCSTRAPCSSSTRDRHRTVASRRDDA